MKFSYNTLDVKLNSKTRSIEIKINELINIEMLFELESLLSWLLGHIEVNAIVLRGKNDYFCSGFDNKELKIMSEEKLKKYIVRFQKIVTGMLYLPQTVICDLGLGASAMGVELSLGADIRVGSETGKIQFNALEKGWVPCCGGIGLLSAWVGNGNARSWLLSGSKISHSVLATKGLLIESYKNKESSFTINKFLKNISRQSPVARIQAKRSFLETILPELERTFEYESIFSFASIETGDWKKENADEFVPARELAKELKRARKKEDLLL